MKSNSTKRTGLPSTPAPPPTNAPNDREQSTTNQKGKHDKIKTPFAGTSTYLLSQTTFMDCAPSRASSSSFANDSKSSMEVPSESPTHHHQQQRNQALYLSKPQTDSNHNNRPMHTVPSESVAMNYHVNPNPTNRNRNGDDYLEAPHHNTVFVEAEVARDVDSIVNQAVTEALRERDRNIVSAVHVEADPTSGENPNQKTTQQSHSFQQEESKVERRRKVVIYIGISIATVAIVAAVVIFLQTFGSEGSSIASNNPAVVFSTSGSESTAPPTKAPSSTLLPRVKETNVFPLGRCEGDCDTDLDCRQGFVCFQRIEFDPVPHCTGGEQDTSRTDYCIPNDATASPLAATTQPSLRPTRSPSSRLTPKPT